MSLWRLATRTVRHFWRANLALLLGIAVGAAVLTGALIVGDSIRDSLRALTIQRLGRIDEILLGEQFFRAEIAESLRANSDLQEHYTAFVPAILLSHVTVELDAFNESASRSQGVTVVGCEPSFWKLDTSGDHHLSNLSIGEDQIVINQPLADELGAKIGDQLLMRIGKTGGMAVDSPLASKSDLAETITDLELVAIIPAKGLGRFSLHASQRVPANAFVSIKTLQDGLDQSSQVNALLAAGNDAGQSAPRAAFESLRRSLAPELRDLGLTLKRVALYSEQDGDRRTVAEYDALSNDRMLFTPEQDQAVRAALEGADYQSVLTYLATRIQKLGPDGRPDGELVPYSTITGVDSNEWLGPVVASAGQPVRVDDRGIVLNRWAADVLEADLGDAIRVTYFEPETTHGEVKEEHAEFVLQHIVSITTPAQPFARRRTAVFRQPPTLANDPDLTPEVPGVTDQESINDWDTPFPIDHDLWGRRDDVYWDNFRATPKAFLSLARSRQLWTSRFGETTSYRLAIDGKQALESRAAALAAKLRGREEAFGLRWLRVKADGLAASQGTTPFDALFLGFSMFIIAAALMLVVLLLRLGLEQRASQLGLLASLGFRWRRSLRLLLLENTQIIALGCMLGVGAGVVYAWLMLVGLRTWWLAAVVTPFMQLSVKPTTLVLGLAGGSRHLDHRHWTDALAFATRFGVPALGRKNGRADAPCGGGDSSLAAPRTVDLVLLGPCFGDDGTTTGSGTSGGRILWRRVLRAGGPADLGVGSAPQGGARGDGWFGSEPPNVVRAESGPPSDAKHPYYWTGGVGLLSDRRDQCVSLGPDRRRHRWLRVGRSERSANS